MTYVLVMGKRKGLVRALSEMNIPFSIWQEEGSNKVPPNCDQVYVKPFPTLFEPMHKFLEEMSLPKKPSFVIASTESAVYPAALVRRYFKARTASESILIRCTNKQQMKTFLSKHNITMTKYMTVDDVSSARLAIAELGLPVVVKDAISSGGRNIVFAKDESELLAAMGPGRLYESFIDGEEGSVESFIHNGKIAFSNITQYYKKNFYNIVPAPFAADEISKILELNKKVIKALGISWGLTHLEFYRKPQGPIFGEIALRPPGGYIMELMSLAYNFDPWQAFVRVELGMDQVYPDGPSQFAACTVVHPGAMSVQIVNLPKQKDFYSFKKMIIKKKVGDVIGPRLSVRDEAGHVIFASKDIGEIISDIKRFEQMQIFEG